MRWFALLSVLVLLALHVQHVTAQNSANAFYTFNAVNGAAVVPGNTITLTSQVTSVNGNTASVMITYPDSTTASMTLNNDGFTTSYKFTSSSTVSFQLSFLVTQAIYDAYSSSTYTGYSFATQVSIDVPGQGAPTLICCQWAVVVHALSASNRVQAAEQTLRCWQSTRHMHHSSEPTRCCHPHPSRTREATLRHSAVDAAVEATQEGACSGRRSAAASRLPTRSHSSTTYTLS